MTKSYAQRSAELADQQGANNYDWTYWAEPEDKLEIAIVRFLRRRHPNAITLPLQSVVDEIKEFVILKR